MPRPDSRSQPRCKGPFGLLLGHDLEHVQEPDGKWYVMVDKVDYSDPDHPVYTGQVEQWMAQVCLRCHAKFEWVNGSWNGLRAEGSPAPAINQPTQADLARVLSSDSDVSSVTSFHS